MKHVMAAGHVIEYQVRPAARPGAGWVVFLHEGFGCAGQWRTFASRVAAATGCGTLVYSRRGHGGSGPWPVPWPDNFLEAEATTQLPDLLAQLGIARPVLYGHSDGGSIALIFAAHFPDACAGVVSTAAHVMFEPIAHTSISATRERFREGRLREILRRHHGANTDDAFLGWADTWLRPAMRTWDVRPLLGAIRCPVLVIQGRDDEYGTLDQVEAIEAGIRAGVNGDVTTLVIDHCGHSPHREKPADVLAAMAHWITKESVHGYRERRTP